MNTLFNEIKFKNFYSEPIRYNGTSVILDKDRSIFPYENWWRGEYMSTLPKIAERDAGFRPRNYSLKTSKTCYPFCYPLCYPYCVNKNLNDKMYFR